MIKIKLSTADVATLRACAEREARRHSGARKFKIEIGERYSLNGRGKATNIRLISDDPEWNDTDLNTTRDWGEIRSPIELSAKGEALLDLYIYERGDGADLVCNVQAEIDAAGLAAVHADADKNRWQRAEVRP
jgi:hypothetical protein